MSELSKQALKVENNSSFPNNNSGLITPQVLRDFNDDMIDSLVDEIGYNVDSASWNQQIDALEQITASQQNSINALNTATQSLQGQLTTIGTQSGSWVTESETGSFAKVNVTNTFTQPQIINGAVTASSALISGLKYPTVDNGVKSFVQTDGNGNLSLQYVETIFETIRNSEAITIQKGTPVYISGSTGDNGNAYIADASNPSKMPAIYIAGETLAPNAVGQAIVLGLIEGVDTSLYPAGTEVYVGVGGGWTATRPTGTAIVQSLGIVTKQGVGGQGVVLNPGPANLPNIQQGYLWVGDSNSYPTAVATSSLVVNVDTASLVTTASFNQYTASNDQRVTSLESATSSYATDTDLTNLSASLTITDNFLQSQIDALDPSGSAASISLLNDFTASQLIINTGYNTFTSSTNTSLTNLNQSSASQQVSIDTLNLFTSSTNTRLTNIESTTASLNSSVTQLNASSASQQVSINNLNTTTASLLIETQNLELFSASALVSISNLNASSASQQVSINSLNAATASYVTETESGSFLITASFDNGTRNLTFTKGNNTTFAVNIPDVSGSGTIDTGSFATTGSNAFFGTNSFSGAVEFTGSAPTILSSSFSGSLITNLTDTFTDVPEVKQIVTLTSASYASLILAGTTNPNTLYVVSGSTTPQTIDTGSFATTGSNVFTGDQTLIDAGGNTITLSDTSGSLMLVAKTYTSASAHLSSSATPKVNIIWKDNNNTVDTIISGSGNIFPNPSTAGAGFKRYIGGNNNIFLAGTIPQISGSMQFSPSMNRNIGSLGVPMRGPVSSSAWNINDNFAGGAVVNLGTVSAPMEKMVSGFNFNSNLLAGGTVNFTATGNTLDVASVFSSNIVFGATLNINHNSSSVNYFSNIQNGGITVNNNYTPTVGSTLFRRVVQTNINTIYGVSHGLNFGGSNTSTGVTRAATANLLAGTYVTASLEETGDNTSMVATNMMGNGLIVSGTSVSPTTPNPAADATYGSTFTGRFNATDGNKAKTAETIFAVGTGTGYANRKTGFLIDSGSNTFVEGTLNVSGTTSLNGDLNITGSLTASLQQGYVWVGNDLGITTTVATSSFGGGGSTDTGSLMVTGSVLGNVLTFTKGDASTFSLTVDTGSGGGTTDITALNAFTASQLDINTGYNTFTQSADQRLDSIETVSGSWITESETGSFATTGSNSFVGNQTITGSLIVSASAIFTGSVRGNVVPLSITSNTASMDLNLGNYFTLTLADTATTHISASNVQPGTSATLVITTGTNSSASLAPELLEPSGSDYVATNGSAKKDVLSFVAIDSTNMFVVATKNMI